MILEFYQGVLESIGCKVDLNGRVSLNFEEGSGEFTPVLVDGKQLVLPTSNQLRDPTDYKWETRALFHPCSEPVLSCGDDPVMSVIRKVAVNKLNLNIYLQMLSLLSIAADTANHPKLKPDQNDLLTTLASCSDKTLTFLSKLQKKQVIEKNLQHVVIYIKKTPTLNGKKYSKGAIVSFPLYEKLLADDKNELGKPAEKKIILDLYKYILPNIDVQDAYSYGSDCKIAPTLVSFMMGFGQIACDLNTIYNKFNTVDDFSGSYINTDYDQVLLDLVSPEMLGEIRSVPHSNNIATYQDSVAKQAQQSLQTNPFGQPQPQMIKPPGNTADLSSMFASNTSGLPNFQAVALDQGSPSWASAGIGGDNIFGGLNQNNNNQNSNIFGNRGIFG